MSINAKVSGVYFGENSEHRLELEPWSDGEQREPPGQPRLFFGDPHPPDANLLAGHQIWGGASSIMHGETEIAKRDGYTAIRFTVPWIGPVIEKERQRREAINDSMGLSRPRRNRPSRPVV